MTDTRVPVGVAVILWNKDGRLLMHRRKGSHGAGTWSVVGGWMEPGEDFTDTAVREAAEEAGLRLDPRSVTFLEAIATPDAVTILMQAQPGAWSGTPQALEPDKIDGDWIWVCPGKVPEPVFAPLEKSRVMSSIRRG